MNNHQETGLSSFAEVSFKNDLSSLCVVLIERYTEIEKKGIEMIIGGRTVANPFLTGELKDTRYSIAAIGFISDSADSFLKEVIEKLKKVEPNARYSLDGFRHITFREVSFNPVGRKSANSSSRELIAYYNAIRGDRLQEARPVHLRLYKVMASIDREQSSVSVIAGLLPTDLNIITVRESINSAISKADLPLVGRLGDIPSVHVTLARFPNPPRRNENGIPLLDMINEINGSITSEGEIVIDKVDVISTTPISYVWVDKHVYVWPPISLAGEQIQDAVRFLRPRQRIEYSK